MRVILIVVAYLIFENTLPSHAYILLNIFILSGFWKMCVCRTCILLVLRKGFPHIKRWAFLPFSQEKKRKHRWASLTEKWAWGLRPIGTSAVQSTTAMQGRAEDPFVRPSWFAVGCQALVSFFLSFEWKRQEFCRFCINIVEWEQNKWSKSKKRETKLSPSLFSRP